MEETSMAARVAAENAIDTAHDELKALEAELDKERAELATAEAKREQARKADQLRSDIAEARRKKTEQIAIAEAEGKYGAVGKGIELVETLDGLVIVKKENGIKLRKWQDQHGDNITSSAVRQLARPNVVHPSLDIFDAWAEERPVILVNIATAILKLGGMRLKELSGK